MWTCYKCKTVTEDDLKELCFSCMTPRKDSELKNLYQTISNETTPADNSFQSPNNTKQAFGVLVICLGMLSGSLFFLAAIKLYLSGAELQTLRSVGGESVAEVYYQQMGKHGVGYAVMSFAFGLGVIAISLGQGIKLIFENKIK